MKIKILFIALSFALAFCSVRNTNAQPPGSLDNTFDGDGKLTTGFGGSNDVGYSVAIQTDGKIVVAGYSYNGSDEDFALVRYNSDGTLDNTFGSGGKVTTDFINNNDEGYSVTIQSDGKIVVAGMGDYEFAVARYNSDGTLDNTFDTDGKVTTAIGIVYDQVSSVRQQTDGKIVVAGYSGASSGYYEFSLVRYNSNGALDNTFGSGGKVTTDFGSYNDEGYAMAIQNDGKIVVAGYSDNGTNEDFAVARYNSGVVGINDLAFQNTEIIIFPNPFTSSATLVINSPLIKGAMGLLFVMYDLLGREVKQFTMHDSQCTIARDNLPSGMYLYKPTNKSKILATGKIIIE